MSKGVEASSWQHPGGQPIDWEAVSAAGYTFAIMKATQGTTYVNPWLIRDLEDARSAGLLVGAYHYVTAGLDGKAQGEHAVEACMGQVLELGLWLDWELDGLADWEVTNLYTPMFEAVAKARALCGAYMGAAWLDTFHRLNIPLRHLWYADWSTTRPTVDCMLWQSGQATVSGIPGETDVDELLKPRSVNLPGRPAARPTGRPVDTRPDDERAEEVAEHEPEGAPAA